MHPCYCDFEGYRSRGPYRRHDGYPPRRVLTKLPHACIALARRRLKRVRDGRELTSLDDRRRRDIGVSASDIVGECANPFWRVRPVNLRQNR